MLNLDMKGRTVIITGGTGQLGRVISKTFAECNADVIIHYHSNEAKAIELQNEIKAMGRECYIVKGDVTDFDSVKSMAEDIEKNFKMPDILINNAVIQYVWKSVFEQDIKDYYSQFESCTMHTVHMVKCFLPHMVENNWGRIIVTNSECAQMAEPGCSAYTGAKRNLDGVVRVLAKEVGEHNITVNQVAPGWTISENDRINGTEKQEAYDSTVPLKRRGTDQEIANMMAFLASDLASFTTGAYIPVCGGRIMPGI